MSIIDLKDEKNTQLELATLNEFIISQKHVNQLCQKVNYYFYEAYYTIQVLEC